MSLKVQFIEVSTGTEVEVKWGNQFTPCKLLSRFLSYNGRFPIESMYC